MNECNNKYNRLQFMDELIGHLRIITLNVPPVVQVGRPAAFKYADENFVARHCLQTTYTLQIVKCNSVNCCGPFRSNYNKRMPNRFLPKPSPLTYSEKGPIIDMKQATESTENAHFPKSLFLAEHLSKTSPNLTDFILPPYDIFCPSAKGKLEGRSISQCGYNAPTAAALKRHDTIHSKISVVDDEVVVVEAEEERQSVVIENLTAWLLGSFADI